VLRVHKEPKERVKEHKEPRVQQVHKVIQALKVELQVLKVLQDFRVTKVPKVLRVQIQELKVLQVHKDQQELKVLKVLV
jgi:hypothetical protein